MLINSELPVKCPTQVKDVIILCLRIMQWEPFVSSSDSYSCLDLTSLN